MGKPKGKSFITNQKHSDTVTSYLSKVVSASFPFSWHMFSVIPVIVSASAIVPTWTVPTVSLPFVAVMTFFWRSFVMPAATVLGFTLLATSHFLGVAFRASTLVVFVLSMTVFEGITRCVGLVSSFL